MKNYDWLFRVMWHVLANHCVLFQNREIGSSSLGLLTTQLFSHNNCVAYFINWVIARLTCNADVDDNNGNDDYLLYIRTSDIELCRPPLECLVTWGDEKRLIMRDSAGGGGNGGGGWLGSRGRFDELDPDEDDVIEASVCSEVKNQYIR